MKREIILASASRRRSRILDDCGITHRVVPSGAVESADTSVPVPELVMRNAESKVVALKGGVDNTLIIGADTLVAHKGKIIGKPSVESEAREMLKAFSGSSLEVYTGIFLYDSVSGKCAKAAEKSELTVPRIEEKDIDPFFRGLAPYDKAGGFSIEGVGSMLFDDIQGSYFNILGLPMIRLRGLFREIGLDILDYAGNK